VPEVAVTVMVYCPAGVPGTTVVVVVVFVGVATDPVQEARPATATKRTAQRNWGARRGILLRTGPSRSPDSANDIPTKHTINRILLSPRGKTFEVVVWVAVVETVSVTDCEAATSVTGVEGVNVDVHAPTGEATREMGDVNGIVGLAEATTKLKVAVPPAGTDAEGVDAEISKSLTVKVSVEETPPPGIGFFTAIGSVPNADR
jgi:hypothetical protein